MLKYSKTRVVQPNQIIKPDYTNPLNEGLSALFYPIAGSLVDVANTKLPTTDTSTSRVGKLGRYRDYADQDTQFANSSNVAFSSGMTAIIIADIDALTNYGGLISCSDSTTRGGYELRLGQSATDSRLLFIRSGDTQYRGYTYASDLLTAGTKDNFIAVSAGVDIQVAPNFYNINGDKITALSATAGGASADDMTASTHDFFVGRREDAVTKLDGAINFIAMFDRELSFEETEEIRRNPYGLLQPRTQYLPISTGAVAPTFIPAWALASQRNRILGAR